MTRGAWAAMRAHAEAAWPLEACGLLLGTAQGRFADSEERVTEARPAANHAPDPARHFAIDPAALLAAFRAAREGGARVLGYYHSHPSGDPAPSPTDRAQAPHDGRIWAIVATGPQAPDGGDEAGEVSPVVRFWRDTAQGFEALSSRLVED